MAWDLGAGLEGKGVLVTGAARGIGKATAEAFASAGAKVLAVDIRGEEVEATVADLEGGGHHAVTADLADLDALSRLVLTAVSELGSLDVLAHIAAVLVRRTSIDDVGEDDWDLQLDINLKSAFFLSRAAAGAMRLAGRGGRIILCSSTAWWTGGSGASVPYAASKGGLVSMARGLARTYGADGITVNCLAPGLVRTPMSLEGLSNEEVEGFTSRSALGRWAEPEEVAGAAVFLASKHAAFITGTTLGVSGGVLMY